LGRLGVEAQAVEAKVEIVVAPFQRQSELTGALRLPVGQAYIGGEIEDRARQSNKVVSLCAQNVGGARIGVPWIDAAAAPVELIIAFN